MKLIEAMNQLKLTEKKLASKIEFVKRYAARPSIREDSFGGKEREKVSEAVQACLDFITRHEDLKRAIDYTNLSSVAEVGGKYFTLHSLIIHKRLLCAMKRRVYAALDDRPAYSEVEGLRARSQNPEKVTINVIANFDIVARDDKKAEIDDLEAAIDSALQIANSKLDLLEPPREPQQKA